MVRRTEGAARAGAGAGQPRRGVGEAATGAALGPGREGVHLRHRGRGTNVRRVVRRSVAAPHLPPDVRAELEAACPGCTGLADHFDAALAHLNNPDVTLISISRAPIEKLQAYKRRMGWQFPYVSSFASDFNFDFDFAFTEDQMATGELAKMVAEADDWLKDWADDVGTDLPHGMAEAPGWNVFKLEDGVVYHTYSRTAPDRFLLAPYYSQLLDQIPGGRDADFPLRRHDEYDDGGGRP